MDVLRANIVHSGNRDENNARPFAAEQSISMEVTVRKPNLEQRTTVNFTVSFIVALLLLPLFIPFSVFSQKLKPEEIVARHLESIGSEKARATVTSRIISGSSHVIFRTVPMGQAEGRAVIASEGVKCLIGMSFKNPVYPREELGFDGSSFIAAFVTPGVRSALGGFLMTHSLVFKQGLMGGTLSSAWPLLTSTNHNAHLEYAGIRKVNDRALHELKYQPRGASDLQISLFFDQQTFQHVRTEYQRVIPATTGNRAYTNVEQRETRYKLVEEFSNFKTEAGLTLPHAYKIQLTVDAQSGTFSGEWMINLTQFSFNERIDPHSFSINAG
jgi:hypothetical protein